MYNIQTFYIQWNSCTVFGRKLGRCVVSFNNTQYILNPTIYPLKSYNIF